MRRMSPADLPLLTLPLAVELVLFIIILLFIYTKILINPAVIDVAAVNSICLQRIATVITLTQHRILISEDITLASELQVFVSLV